MRLPRPRFTLRGSMLAVAISALLLGVWLWGERRRAQFSALARWHERQVLWNVCVIVGHPGPDGEYIWEPRSRPQEPGNPPASPRQQRISTWHYQMAMKYDRATGNPWLPVAPDPPPPEP
jgi:hypothetical protein